MKVQEQLAQRATLHREERSLALGSDHLTHVENDHLGTSQQSVYTTYMHT